MISIVNYGMGNLGSVVNMFKRIGYPSIIIDKPTELLNAQKILLPGVGAFDNAMKQINDIGFAEVLNKKVLVEKVPILGICLGMQLLTRGSDEGNLKGLGWIEADTLGFPSIEGLKVPHMGWNQVIQSSPSVMTNNLIDDTRFYFVHSYRVKVDNEKNSILKCDYGTLFDAAIQKDNIFGAQFHPEKSHKFGMRFLENFAKL